MSIKQIQEIGSILGKSVNFYVTIAGLIIKSMVNFRLFLWEWEKWEMLPIFLDQYRMKVQTVPLAECAPEEKLKNRYVIFIKQKFQEIEYY